MSLQCVSRDTRIYTLGPDNRPAAIIRSGDEIMVETWDAFEGVRDAALLSERTLRGPPPGRSMWMTPSLATR
jgi:acetamidase/formamidase